MDKTVKDDCLQMMFPAGILQPPFFNEDQPMALNFGHIGTFMGHEVSITIVAAAAVAKSVKRLELRSLKEMQRGQCEFDSWSRHRD